MLLLMVFVQNLRLMSVAKRNKGCVMLVIISLEMGLWIIFAFFVRYCLTAKRLGGHVPFKVVPFSIFTLGTVGAIANLISFIVLYHSTKDTLAYKVFMFVLSAGFLVRMCLGLTVSEFYRR